ncbi:MAG: hypothetical protein PHP44_10020 [Kiritimatiellae bacterium]|nr:hypothetical protein [Kiritimatiellia bacterium]
MKGLLNRYLPTVLFIGLLLLFSALIFQDVLMGGLRMTTDDNIGHLAEYQSRLPGGFLSGMWQESPLIGMPATASPLNWSNVWLALLSTRAFANFFHPICLLAGSLALAFYLRRKGLAPIPILLGVLTAFWLGSNFTLIYAGHIRKFAILFLFCANLICLDLLFEKKRWEWGVLTGALLGLMFLEQQDVALFFGLFLGAYALFQWVQAGHKTKDFALLLPVPILALLLAAFALQSAFQQNISNASGNALEEERGKWEYCTQWSFPPEELIAFVAPGYTGWRSGEPDGPYWGRMGRSAGWEQTHQGFMNFKLENTYIGIIPLALGILALFACRGDPRRNTILFWGGAGALALLLSFGKFTPLYRLFWQLPVIHEIRNPNKFLQVFQLAAGILTAYGADVLLKHAKGGESPLLKRLFWIGTALTALLLLFAVGASGSASALTAQGWPQQMADIIASNKIYALLHAAALSALLAFFAAIYTLKKLEKLRPYPMFWAALLATAVLIDSALLSRHYVKTLPESYIAENPVTTYLKKHLGTQRVALATQEGFYNLWLTYLFPYHKIPAFNFSQMPRMAEDYKQVLEALGRQPLRLWQLSGVGYLLAPSAMENQLPPGAYQPVLRFDVTPLPDGELSVRAQERGAHTLYESLAPAPRFAFFGGAEILDDRQTTQRLASKNWNPFNKIILPENTNTPLPDDTGFAGHVDVVEHQPGKTILSVQAEAAGYLRAADKFNPDWQALVDGAPSPILRADYLSQAVYIPAGNHRVELIYAPSNRSIQLQLAGYGLTLAAILSLLIRKTRLRA